MTTRIIVSSPSMELGGANKTMASLLNALKDRGCEPEWICTGHNPTSDDGGWLGERRFKMHSLPSTQLSAVRQRQALLLDHLRKCSPCIYIPNFDFDMACAVPALSPESAAVFIVHSDEPIYYDFVADYGHLFNAIVCVSRFITEKLQRLHPEWAERIVHIPFGVDCPARIPTREKEPSAPLEVAYCGRLSFYQKRIQDLAEIIRRCHLDRLPVRFRISGSGPDEKAFFQSIAQPLAEGTAIRVGFLSNAQVLDLFANSDALVITSDFEGLPAVLLEAMAYGCVPVVSHTVSGMAEVVQSDENGFLVPIGDVDGFVRALARLAAEPELRHHLGSGAFERIKTGGFTLTRAAADYENLFKALLNNPNRISYKRNCEVIVPEKYRLGAKIQKRINWLLRDVSAQ